MRLPLLPLFLLGAPLPLLAQAHPTSTFPVASAADLRSSAGLVAQPDGSFLAGGADYRAHIDAAGLVYQPALGSAVERTQGLALSLRSIERGGVPVLAAPAPAAPLASGLSLALERGPGVVERFDVHPEGVELSYVFERPLAGSGDLVVRLGLATELPRPADGAAETLAFELPGVGGATVGAVLGVDADGRTAQGSLRLSGDELALVLPGAFVDQAAYPLVLDPLVGSTIVVSASGNDDTHPDAAFDGGNDVYLVVWQRIFSATDSDIRGQRISGTGALAGSTIFFGSTDIARDPAVANLAAKNRFAVVWVQDADAGFLGTSSQVKVQFAEAATGAIGAVATPVTVFGGQLFDPDVCGEGIEQPYAGDEVELALVYNDEVSDEIRLVGGQFNAATDALTWDAPKTLFADDSLLLVTYSEPSIARSSGIYGRAVVAVRRSNFLSNDTVRGVGVSVDGSVLGTSFGISDGAFEASAPDIDGFDRQFMAAWQGADADGKTRIQMAPIALNISTGAATIKGTFDAAVPGLFNNESRPAVGYSGGKTWIGYRDVSTLPLSSALRIKGFDSLSCVLCEGSLTLDSGSSTAAQWVSVCTPTSGGAYYDDRGLATWSIVGLGGDVEAQLLTNNQQQGTTQNLGGGCGQGGTIGFSAPASIGSSWWWSYIIGLPADAVQTWVNFAFADPSLSLACGSCIWMPWQYFYSPPMQYDPLQGNAASGVALIPCNPALVGAQFVAQWTTYTPSSAPCSLFPGFSLSDRYRVTIGQ